MKRCDGCRFWIKDREENLDGSCRRNPPTPFTKMAMNPITQQSGIVILAFWAKTRPELWCGCYRRRPRLIPFCYRFIIGGFWRAIGSLFGRKECLTKEKPKNISADILPIRKSSLN
jgi:hypothetical protein